MKRFLALLCVSVILLTSCAKERPGEFPDGTPSSPLLTDSETAETSSEDTEDWFEWNTEAETEPDVEEEPQDTDFNTDDDEEELPTEPLYYEVDGYVYRIDVSKYLSYIAPKNDEEYLILANRNHYLSSSYSPDDLVRTKANYDKKMRKAACNALNAMFAEMKVLGVCDTIPQSTYRSFATQQKVYESYLEKERKRHPLFTEEQIVALVQQYSSPPGASDHQTGLAVDFSPISASFRHTKAFRYLSENAHKFGFILRFPEGKTHITGYMYESWHWRFVGRKAATEIHRRNLTLEEYLEELYGGILPPDTGAPDPVIPDSELSDSDVPDTEPLDTENESSDTAMTPPTPDESDAFDTEGESASPDESGDDTEMPPETLPDDGGGDTTVPDPESTLSDTADSTQTSPVAPSAPLPTPSDP